MAPSPYCPAQAAFIKSVRAAMDADPKKFLREKDWRNIQPKSPRHGKQQLDVQSFYLKPVACFAPHAIIPGHVPVCPRCESPSRVDTQGSNVRWIKNPKTLFGINGHKYLDTKFYWCGACRKRFAGYDKRSMQLSAKVWLGFFPFNLSDRFAVDHELYSLITTSANEPTSNTHYLGVSKLKKLIDRGITTGLQLLERAECNDPFIKWRWTKTVENYFNTLRSSIADLTALEEEYLDQVLLEELALEKEPADEEPATPPPAAASVQSLPPVFSKFDDPAGYNGRVLSWSRINSVLRTEFGNRKHIQDSKMRGLKATILKIDFQYELAKKIRVWKGQGCSYVPFQCIITVLNEHGLCVYWKALTSSESLKEVEDDLRKLDQWLQYNAKANESTVKAVYIDNCCTVAKVDDKIREIFKAAEVKLDCFHWQQRWDAVLDGTTSKEASYFRAAMRRAVFVVNPEEFNHARDVVAAKKKRRPTTKEVLVEARTTIPESTILRERVQKVLGYFYYMDSVANAALLNGEDPSKWPRFFKPVTDKVRHAINRQLHHVDNGCLSDPTTCDIHITNPITGKHYVARGTSMKETANRYLNALLGNSIGIDRADRLLNCFFEVWNDKIQTDRLGAEDFRTVRTEALALLNSLADGAGYQATDLPFPTLSRPCPLPNKFKETMGLDFQFPEHADVSNPVDMSNVHRLNVHAVIFQTHQCPTVGSVP